MQRKVEKLLDAFAMLQPRLMAMAQMWTSSHALAEDLVQDVWLKLDGVTCEDAIRSPMGYVTQVTQNTLADHVRKQRRRAVLDRATTDLLWELTDEISPERIVMGRQSLKAVEAVLARMPERSRDIFLMNRINGITHRGIAQRLGISEEAVYYHIRRTLEALAEVRGTVGD